MALDFPTSPSVNDTVTIGAKTWQYNGKGWKLLPLEGAIKVEHKILDDISGSFNGSTTSFTLSSSSTNFINSEITSAARLMISVGGVVQQPDPTQTSGFYISGGTNISTDPIVINFVEAPKAGQDFFGVAYGLSVSPSDAFVTEEQSIVNSIVFGV